MKLIITGGGTGGHVSPAIAVISTLRERAKKEKWNLELLYVGSHQGIERKMIEPLGVPFVSIRTGKLRRYFS